MRSSIDGLTQRRPSFTPFALARATQQPKPEEAGLSMIVVAFNGYWQGGADDVARMNEETSRLAAAMNITGNCSGSPRSVKSIRTAATSSPQTNRLK
jgi:hypothetical protein